MHDTCCEAYNDLGTIPMEVFLYHWEYSDYNYDNALDDLIYYQLFECGAWGP